MNAGQQSIVMAAHNAAVKAATRLAEADLCDRYWNEHVPGPILRRETLRRLAEVNMPQAVTKGRQLVPLHEGVIEDDEGESATAWAVYSRAEYLAWVQAFGWDNLLDSSEDIDNGAPCPKCGGLHVFDEGRRYGYLRCQDCDACYTTPDLRMSELASQLTGWGQFYGGPGRSFGHHPTVKVGRNRILVKQNRGLDI